MTTKDQTTNSQASHCAHSVTQAQPMSKASAQPTLKDNSNDHTLYNQALHTCCELSTPRDDQIVYLTTLFPAFTNTPTYDKLLNPTIMLMYAEGRGIGLSTHQAAHAADMSTLLIDKVLAGEGVSIEKFMELIKVELHSIAHTKRLQLTSIVVSGAQGNEKAAQAALEHVFPTEYGKHLQLEQQVEEEVHMSYSVREPEQQDPEETDNVDKDDVTK